MTQTERHRYLSPIVDGEEEDGSELVESLIRDLAAF